MIHVARIWLTVAVWDFELVDMHKYKSLAAWQHAHFLLIEGHGAIDKHFHPRSSALFDQFRRSIVSVEANIVEGFALSTTPLFRRHLRIALGSAAEAESMLDSVIELDYLPRDRSEPLKKAVDRTLGALYGLLRSTRINNRTSA
jgi:four helix bundle protein